MRKFFQTLKRPTTTTSWALMNRWTLSTPSRWTTGGLVFFSSHFTMSSGERPPVYREDTPFLKLQGKLEQNQTGFKNTWFHHLQTVLDIRREWFQSKQSEHRNWRIPSPNEKWSTVKLGYNKQNFQSYLLHKPGYNEQMLSVPSSSL